VHSPDASCLVTLTRSWKEAGLWITRAKVKAHGEEGHTFYVMDSSGGAPDVAKVRAACQASGGRLQAMPESGTSAGGGAPPPPPLRAGDDPNRFYFAFLQRQWDGQAPDSATSL